MNFVLHAAEAEEVLEFVKNSSLSFKPSIDVAERFAMTADFEGAVDRARTQEFSDGRLWTDVLAWEIRGVLGEYYACDNWRSAKVTPDVDAVGRLVQRRLPKEYREVTGEVCNDMYNCFIKRAIRGRKPDLFEDIFDAYRAGYWPCGWEGEYPSGRLVVFGRNQS
jgi:hypothetical protein